MVRESRLFLGNPGTGKSTLINCLVGTQVFKAGVNWGAGLTQDYQRYVSDDVAYMDTPGLADRAIIKKAAEAITKALKEGGNYKLFFMVRLNNGRPVYEDLTTVERVLESIDVPKISYSIIINHIGKKQYSVLKRRGSEFEQVTTIINGIRFETNHFCLIPLLPELEEGSDCIVQLPMDVIEFIDSKAPSNCIKQSNVKSIELENFSQQTETIRGELEQLRRQLLEMEQRYQAQFEVERARHAEELERLRYEHRSRNVHIDAVEPYTELFPSTIPEKHCEREPHAKKNKRVHYQTFFGDVYIDVETMHPCTEQFPTESPVHYEPPAGHYITCTTTPKASPNNNERWNWAIICSTCLGPLGACISSGACDKDT